MSFVAAASPFRDGSRGCSAKGRLGDFPALAEVWITTPAGDPFCVVFPQPGSTSDDATSLRGSADGSTLSLEEKHGNAGRAAAMPELGQTVRFTGTFLKMVSYVGGDGARLAPLVVGDRPPISTAPKPDTSDSSSKGTDTPANGDNSHSSMALGLAYWAIALAMLALGAVILARWRLRAQPG